MIYENNKLILDNFRTVLKDYSIDVQDVVRSAILDGVDITKYIESCKNNAYRLDQIRLGMKENLEEIFLNIKNGDSIYKIRKLKEKGVSLTGIQAQIKQGVLNEESLNKLISWVESGYNIENINISIIPKSLFEVFEQGFQKGFDMKIFNDGRNYKPMYVRYCLVIMANRKDIHPFLSDNLWSEDCIKQLAVFSKIRSQEKWSNLIRNINSSISSDKLDALISCVKNGINISILSGDDWTAQGIRFILKAFENNLDYNSLISVGPDEDTILTKLNEIMLNKNKRVSGRLRKN